LSQQVSGSIEYAELNFPVIEIVQYATSSRRVVLCSLLVVASNRDNKNFLIIVYNRIPRNHLVTSKPLPGPQGLPLIGHVTPFIRHGILGAFDLLSKRYGPMYRVPLPFGNTAIVLAHPDGVERVLRSNRENYHKGSVYDGARLLLGEGLVTAEGRAWERQRALAQPAFNSTQLDIYLRTMTECTEDLLCEWRSLPAGNRIDLTEAATRLTLAIAGRTLFGLDLSGHSNRAGKAFRDGLRGIGSRGPGGLAVPLWLPTPVNVRFRRALVTLDQLVYDIIRRFRTCEASNAAGTLLDMLMAARDPETGRGLTDRQLRDEIVTLYLAGHETTANMLVWTFYLLSRSLDVHDRLEQELDTLPEGPPSLATLKGLEYAQMVLSEALRLYPPAWTIARNVIHDDEVCGYKIPGGSFVLLSPYITQRLEEFWPDPGRFDPQRFSAENIRGRHRFAWFPFSAGPRVCIGKQFSMLEGQLILAQVMREFRVSVDSGTLGFKAEGTLHPDRPVYIRLVKR
jgi:cytochrome P450